VNLRRWATTCALAAALVGVGAVRADAQEGAFVEAMAELSPVQIGTYQTTWRVGRVAGGVQTSRGGWNAAVERHERGSLIDWTGQAGAFQRLGDWTWDANAAYSREPQFLYRDSLEAGLSRRVVGGLVLRGGYRYLEFPATTVRIVEPGATFYFRRGELGAQGFLVRNDMSRSQSSIAMLRSAIDLSRHVSVSGGAAIGARIFDADSLGRGSHDAWQAFGSLRVHGSGHWTVELLTGGAHEDPLFTQQTIATRVRWTF
jgi:YaiO family outer membrane protein